MWVIRARWTTARAVSGGAVLRLREVSPVFSPEKLRIGRVVSWDLVERESCGVLERGSLRVGLRENWWDFEEKREEEKKEREREDEVAIVVVAIVVCLEFGGRRNVSFPKAYPLCREKEIATD